MDSTSRRYPQGHGERITALCALGGDRVVTGSDDDTACVWDVASGQCLQTFEGHTDSVWAYPLWVTVAW